MISINILTNHTAPNSRAFNTPLSASAGVMLEKGIKICFHFTVSAKLFNADILFVNSNYFRTFWQSGRKNEIFGTLENAKKHGMKVLWFDTTDSTWCTQFEVMPYVDRFLKSHLLKDKKRYLTNFRTGRIFTDYFDKLYGAGEKEENYLPLDEKYLDKLSLSWAPCFEYYDENRYTLLRKISNKTRRQTINIFPAKLNIIFTPVIKERPVNISARFGLSHSRPSVVAHRKAIAEILSEKNVDCSRVSLTDYFKEMQNAQISVSPYGVGEFCYRDYESIICGATLIKPDMSHLETWPNFYQQDQTFIFHKWDLSDFEEKVDFLLENPDYAEKIANNAQQLYKYVLSNAGIAEFAERVTKMVI